MKGSRVVALLLVLLLLPLFAGSVSGAVSCSPEEIAATGVKFYHDADRDGYGDDALDFQWGCSNAGDYTAKWLGDCNDGDATMWPSWSTGLFQGWTEILYNTKDDDCNPATEDDGTGCSSLPVPPPGCVQTRGASPAIFYPCGDLMDSSDPTHVDIDLVTDPMTIPFPPMCQYVYEHEVWDCIVSIDTASSYQWKWFKSAGCYQVQGGDPCPYPAGTCVDTFNTFTPPDTCSGSATGKANNAKKLTITHQIYDDKELTCCAYASDPGWYADDGSGNRYNFYTGNPLVATEICGNAIDEDCDGSLTNGCCGDEGAECCASSPKCNGALWCDNLLPFTHTTQGSIHGAPAPGLCCPVGQVAKDVPGVGWQCIETDPCGPITPPTSPPVFPADYDIAKCTLTQACCADIVQKGPSSYESMCVPLGSSAYALPFVVY